MSLYRTLMCANGPASMWGLGLCDGLKRPCMLAIVGQSFYLNIFSSLEIRLLVLVFLDFRLGMQGQILRNFVFVFP